MIINEDHYYGYCGACATEAGVVWLGGEQIIEPIFWRVDFEN